MSRRRPACRSVWWVLAALVAQGLLVQCTRELAPGRGEGGLDLHWRWPTGWPASSTADSARVWLLNSGGGVLAGPVVAPVSSEGEVDFLLRVPAGEDRTVRLQFEGLGARGRGLFAAGEAAGVDVPPGGSADVEVSLRSVVPRLSPISASPGDDRYQVRWSRVPLASSYELLERVGGDEAVRGLTDTSFVVLLPVPAKSLALELATTLYRVRAVLPWGGRSVVSDSVGVTVAAINDLPRILEVGPADGASGVPDSAAISLRFDRAIDPASLGDVTVPSEGNSVILRRAPDGAPRPLLYEWLEGGVVLRLQPASPLDRDATYRISVLSTLRDLEGRPLDQYPTEVGLQGFASEFRTEPYDPLRVTSVVPADGASGLLPRLEVTARLNRPARIASVNAATVLLADSAGTAIPAAVGLVTDSLIRLTPNAALRFGARYRFTVTPEVRDRRGSLGEPLDQDAAAAGFQPFQSSFRVVSQPPGPRVLSASPSEGTPNVEVDAVMRVRFSRPVQSSTVAGNLSVRRLPVGAAISGSLSGSADRREWTFTPAALERGLRYRIVVSAGGYDPEGRPFGILDDESIPFDQDSTQAGYQEFSSLFRVEENPRVVAVAPADGRTGVPVDTVVAVRFSLPVSRTSVAAGGLTLRAGASVVPIAEFVWSPDTTEVRMHAASPLAYYRSYTVTADTSIRSTRGSRFDQNFDLPGAQPFASGFRTATDGIAPRVLVWSPGDTAQHAPITSHVRILFNRAIRPATLDDENNFYLRRLPGGTVVPTARAIDADSAGATLTPLAPLDYLTEYEVTVTKFVEDPFGQQLDQDPETPFNQNFVGRFRTDQERTPPAVADVDPGPGADEVPVEAPVTVTFTEPMGYAGTLEGALSLTGPDGPVAGTAILSTDARTLVFTPAALLRPDVRFDVRVDTIATDQAGNRLDQFPATGQLDPFESFFSTAPDRRSPQVSGSTPAEGDTAVEVTVRPTVLLDEVCDLAALTAGVRLIDSLLAVVVPADVVPAADGRSVELIPADSLRFDSLYRLEATDGVVDTSGNALDQDGATPGNQAFRATFRTRKENLPPRVREVIFAAGPPLPVDGSLRVVFNEPVDAAGLAAGITLHRDGQPIAVNVSALAPDTALVVPADTLAYDAEHLLSVAGVRDLVGNELDQEPDTPGPQPFTLDFRTEPDLVSPRVTWVFPPADTTGVSPEVELAVYFSEPVDPTSVVSPAFALYHTDLGAELVPGTISDGGDGRLFRYRPATALLDSARYLIRVDEGVRDLAGNPFDQDPSAPGPDPFLSEFYTGVRPHIVLGAPLCDPSDTTHVAFDATGTEDPDGVLRRAIWDWGDGQRDTLTLPDPRWPAITHDYACLDARGCDGIDNDADGTADETGPGGCDESYRVILAVEDTTGLWAVDTTGVAFCAFLAFSSTPADGATEVDSSLAAVRVRVSRDLPPPWLEPERVTLRVADGDTLDVVLTWEADSSDVVITPTGGLHGATTYELFLGPGLTSADGRPFDQSPCEPGRQGYEATFTTRSPAPPVAPRRLLRR